MADEPRTTSPSEPLPEDRSQPFSGCLARLIWMGFGNLALLMIAVSILHEPPRTFTVKDALFWLTVGALVGLRYLDVTRLRGLTVHGEPATLRHFARYAGGVVGVSSVLWLLAHLLHLRT